MAFERVLLLAQIAVVDLEFYICKIAKYISMMCWFFSCNYVVFTTAMKENCEFLICFRNNESMYDAVCSASTGLVNDKELPMNNTEGLCCCRGKIDLHLFVSIADIVWTTRCLHKVGHFYFHNNFDNSAPIFVFFYR